MRIITNNELLQLQLDILRDVDTFCRKNEIEYFLVGGTGIGAIRHGGYIPWDDDIDIGMTRPNYDKFLKSFRGRYDNLNLYAPELDWKWYAPYANVCDNRTLLIEGSDGHNGCEVGVKIDIFPYDAVPSNYDEFNKMRNHTRYMVNSMFYKRRSLFKMNLLNFRDVIGTLRIKAGALNRTYESMQKEIHDIAKSIDYDRAEYLEKIVFPYPDNIPCKREIFESYVDIKFENMIVRNLAHYDEYLRSVFGDYMQLPPEEKRHAHHGFTAYWK